MRRQRIEAYIQQHNEPHKQRETIFSTPTVVEKMVNYKGLDSKKHYSKNYMSDSMQVDYLFLNVIVDGNGS